MDDNKQSHIVRNISIAIALLVLLVIASWFIVNKPGSKITTETQSKTSLTGDIVEKALPENWSGSIPTYPGATVLYSGTVDKTSTKGQAAVFSSKDSMEKIAEYYKTTLSGSGWSTAVSTPSKTTIVVTATNSTQQISVILTKNSTGTNISVNLVTK